MGIFLLILGIVLFIGLVVVHEWGHFVAARRGGVEAEEFSIFFPPRIFSRKTKAGWRFSIGLLPLGGYVKLKGEHDTDKARGSFGAASLSTKTKIMAAGVAMNFVVAYLLLVLVAVLGMPKLVGNQFTVARDTHVIQNNVYVGYIEPHSPAAQAGLHSTDQIIGYKPTGQSTLTTLKSAADLPAVTTKYAGQTVTFELKRGQHVLGRAITLRSDAQVAAAKKQDGGLPPGHLGIDPSELTLRRSTWSAPIVAGGLMGQFTGLTFQGLGRALAGLGGIIAGGVTGNTHARQAAQTKASSQVAGPVGIYFVLKSGSILGYQYVLFVVALISLTLAIMNILPIPALDGGRLWLTLIARGGFKRPLTARTEELVNAAGFCILITLIILISIVDVRRFF